MALVVVAEHSGEFEKIMQLSERCYFSLRTYRVVKKDAVMMLCL